MNTTDDPHQILNKKSHLDGALNNCVIDDDFVEKAAREFARLFLEQCLYRRAHDKKDGGLLIK